MLNQFPESPGTPSVCVQNTFLEVVDDEESSALNGSSLFRRQKSDTTFDRLSQKLVYRQNRCYVAKLPGATTVDNLPQPGGLSSPSSHDGDEVSNVKKGLSAAPATLDSLPWPYCPYSEESDSDAECDGDKGSRKVPNKLLGLTTVMLRNVPLSCEQKDLIDEVHAAGFSGQYDFFYLPGESHGNRGYAFVNFRSAAAAEAFYQRFHGRTLASSSASSAVQEAPLVVLPADVQGFEENAEAHYAVRLRRRRQGQKHREPLILRPLPPHLARAELELRTKEQARRVEQDTQQLSKEVRRIVRQTMQAVQFLPPGQELASLPCAGVQGPGTGVQSNGTKFCTQCGSPVGPGFRFCVSCGASIIEIT